MKDYLDIVCIIIFYFFLQTYSAFQKRMVILVQRMLCDHLLELADIQKKVVKHIPHQHSQALREKSTVVSCFYYVYILVLLNKTCIVI